MKKVLIGHVGDIIRIKKEDLETIN